MSSLEAVSLDYARELIDFAPSSANGRPGSGPTIGAGFGESQLEGTVAAFNMIARNQLAYVADEVGMGKTYVALGVMGLLRHFNPNARVVVIAPRENIQIKWVKELRNFVRNNWCVVDNRMKSIQGTPARQPRVCHSLHEFARELALGDDRDFFLRMTSFSLALKQPEARRRYRKQLRRHLPWIPRYLLSSKNPDKFRDQYGRVLNAIVPEIDLLVVDEAHNLKKGFGPNVATRNRILGLALGHPEGEHPDYEWYGPRVKRVLCLSATPFEDDYADLWRQLSVLGLGEARIGAAKGKRFFGVQGLADRDASEDRKRAIVSNLLIRRVTYMVIGGERHTKNMYRREWRYGGYTQHDKAMAFDDPRQRLIVGLVQKKVAEVLGDERFGNRFQIGMLSSFESFLETVSGYRRRKLEASAEETEESEDGTGQRIFDGRQTQDDEERRGADSLMLDGLITSYREQFGVGLPHPKLDATAEALESIFETGDKALVFVRRVATVGELAEKLDRLFDCWIYRKMVMALPELSEDIDGIFERFKQETRQRREEPAPGQPRYDVSSDGTKHAGAAGIVDEEDELLYQIDEDEGGTENFFSWFFRGAGPPGILSGAAFQKNRLAALSAAYSTMFEDDLVSWLLGRPNDPLSQLAIHAGLTRDGLTEELRQLAWAYFRRRTTQVERYPRYYVFEAYQSAALHLLEETGQGGSDDAGVVLRERFPDFRGDRAEPPPGFPQPESAIGVSTFFTELVRRPELRELIWPAEASESFRLRFRRREQRRELLGTMARLGGAYIDLYLLAIKEAGSFELRRGGDDGTPRDLATAFVDLLDEQRETLGLHAYAELRGAASTFDTLIAVNFPQVPDAPLSDLAEIFGRALQQQNPVGRMSGRVAGRIVGQFRMPGFPLVLISTDVLQEGEDLHTFCRKVIHYGITWTPSAMEQRTGRIDRIGSLVQRQLDGRKTEADDEEKIQVHYPHLIDTVEVLQVRRVLHRLDRFMRLIYEQASVEPQQSTIDKNREILELAKPPPPLEGCLTSAFPGDEWFKGKAHRRHRRSRVTDVDGLKTLLERFWKRLVRDLAIEHPTASDGSKREGVLLVSDGELVDPRGLQRPERTGDASDQPTPRRQLFRLELRSAGIDGITFVRCSSEVGLVNLSDPDVVDHLYNLQQELGRPRVCARRALRHHQHRVTVEASLPFDRRTTQYEELVELVTDTTRKADRIEELLLAVDAEPDQNEQGA